MASKKISVRAAARDAARHEARLRSEAGKQYAKAIKDGTTHDSFQNFLFNFGIGTDNPTSSATYGFNPISRNHTLLEWIHRGSWLGGLAVDIPAEDMTRAGIDVQATMPPKDGEALQGALKRLGVWEALRDNYAWARLYGGSIGVLLIDGQDVSFPLRLDTIAPKQFQGVLVLDRWMVEPSLDNLISDYGPMLGLPKFYRVTAGAPALRNQKVHYSRIVRSEGIKLPYFQRLQENLWGLSVLERLYDRMIAFDSATQGASQLVYKSYLRYVKIDNFREAVAAGGDAMLGVSRYLDMMRRFQGVEGMTVIDAKDDFGSQTHQAFSGLADALQQFGMQLSGALQIPLVRLFGQSPAGLNSSGDSDLRTYYDGINSKQEKELRLPMDLICRIVARSEQIILPDNFNFTFTSLWQLQPTEKADVATKRTQAVMQAAQDGVLKPATVLKELRNIGHETGTFSTIEDQEIEEAEAMPAPGMMPPAMPNLADPLGDPTGAGGNATVPPANSAGQGLPGENRMPV